MKKLLLFIGMSILALGLAAQETGYLLSDQKVEPPKFKGNDLMIKKEKPEPSPICCYIQNNLDLPTTPLGTEGVVVVEFTINSDGSLSDFIITNTVHPQLEKAVIDCIKKTEGQWQPGLVNNIPSPMERRIYVKFDDPNNASFEELARKHYLTAIKLHNKGCYQQKDLLLSEVKQKRQSTRLFNKSLAHLNAATVYCPNNHSITIWKARNYNHLNNKSKTYEMINKSNEYLSMEESEQKLQNFYNLAIITR